jgi:membrane-bound hydrogenase subunit beta
MSAEQEIQDQLAGKFAFLKDKLTITRPRRMFAEVSPANLLEVFDWLVKKMDFSILCTITGSDRGETFEAMYHLTRPAGVVLTLVVSIPKSAAVLQSVSNYFPAADAYERELIDLLGIDVLGLPPGNRYPLPDSWPQGVFPLRKDCDLSVLDKGGPQ